MDYYTLPAMTAERDAATIMALTQLGNDALVFFTFAEKICMFGMDGVYSSDVDALTSKENIKYLRCQQRMCSKDLWHDQNTPSLVLFKTSSSITEFMDTYFAWHIDAYNVMGIQATYSDDYQFKYNGIRFGVVSTVKRDRTFFTMSSCIFLTLDNNDVSRFVDPTFFTDNKMRGVNDIGLNVTKESHDNAFISTFEKHWNEKLIFKDSALLNVEIEKYKSLYNTDSWLKDGIIETSIS